MELDLYDFEMIAAIGHAASTDTERIIAHCVSIAPSDGGLEVAATDSFVVAQRSFTQGIDGFLRHPILVSSSALFEVMNAINRMVRIERSKYDPTGWRVQLAVDEELVVTAINPFKETRGSVTASLVDGELPDFARIEDTPALPVSQVGFNPSFAVRLAKSTGFPKATLAWRFTGERSVVHVRAGSSDLSSWRGMMMPAVFDRDFWEVAS